jgi:hypothetical protein
MEYDNNHFIIASRAYSLQSPPAIHAHTPTSIITVPAMIGTGEMAPTIAYIIVIQNAGSRPSL